MCDREPAVWFHEVFKQDGTPYRQDEVDLIRKLTGASEGSSRRPLTGAPCASVTSAAAMKKTPPACRQDCRA